MLFNKIMKQQTLILIGILAIIIILLVRINTESKFEFFEDVSIPYGELLIKRNGENLSIFGFEMNTNKMKLIDGTGAKCLENCEIIIKCENPKRLESICVEGLQSFDLLSSDTGNNYVLVNNFIEHNGGFIHNVINQTHQKVIGKYFKIVNKGGVSYNNVKVELYGVEDIASQKITMINGDKLSIRENKTPSHYEISMPSNDDHLLYYLKFKTNCEYVKLIFRHLGEKTKYSLPCKDLLYNVNNTNNLTDGYSYIFFPHPTLVRTLHIIPMSDNEGKTPKTISNLSVFGKVVVDKAKYIEQSRYYCNVEYIRNGGDAQSPEIIENFQNAKNDSKLLQSFTDTEKLCEALEYQENIKTEKLKIEKNKVYMLKLMEQEQEINSLVNMINKLKVARDKREKSDEILKLSMYETQKNDEAKTIDLVQNRLDNQQNLAVNLNLQPYKR